MYNDDDRKISLESLARFKHLDGIRSIINAANLKEDSEINGLVRKYCATSDVLGETVKSYLDNETMKSLFQRRGKTLVKINEKLEMSEKVRLENSFPEYSLEFRGTVGSNHHPFSAVHRRLMYKRFLSWLNVKPGYKPSKDYDVLVKDVGCNPIMAIENEITSLHGCCPIMSVEDNVRHASSQYMMENFYLRNPDCCETVKKELARRFLREDVKYMCRDPAQYCTVKAENLIFCHSTYELNPDKVATIMHVSGAKRGIGCFLFDKQILLNDEGYLKNQRCRYSIFLKKYKDGSKKRMIKFWFDGDVQNAYVHEFKNYVSMLKTNVIVKGDYSYVYSLKTLMDEVLTFEVFRSNVNYTHASVSYRTLPLANYGEFVVIYGYKWSHKSEVTGDGIKGKMYPKRYIMKTRLFKNIYSYAYNLPPGRFTVENVITAARSMNEKMVINGTAVHLTSEEEKFDEVELPDVCVLIYFLVYVAKFENSKTLLKLKENEEYLREFAESGFLKSVCMRINSIFSTGAKMNDLHSDLVRRIEGKEEKVENVFVRLFNSVLRGSIKNKYKVISQLVPAVLTLEEQIDAFLLDAELEKEEESFDKYLNHSAIRDYINFETKIENVVDYNDRMVVEKVVNCDANLVLRTVPGDGDCLFHALLIASGINYTVRELKNTLLDSDGFKMLSENERENQRKILTGNEWGDRVTIMLFCKQFSYSVCVHTVDACLRFFEFPSLIHLRYNGSHYDAFEKRPILLKPIFELVRGKPVEFRPVREKIIENYLEKFKDSDVDDLELRASELGNLRRRGLNLRKLSMQDLLNRIPEVNELNSSSFVLDIGCFSGCFISALQSFVPVLPYGLASRPYNAVCKELHCVKDEEDDDDCVLASVVEQLMGVENKSADLIYFETTVRKKKVFMRQVTEMSVEQLSKYLDFISVLCDEKTVVVLSCGQMENDAKVLISSFISKFEDVNALSSLLIGPLRTHFFLVCRGYSDKVLDVDVKFLDFVLNNVKVEELKTMTKCLALKTNPRADMTNSKLCSDVISSFKVMSVVESAMKGGFLKSQVVEIFVDLGHTLVDMKRKYFGKYIRYNEEESEVVEVESQGEKDEDAQSFYTTLEFNCDEYSCFLDRKIAKLSIDRFNRKIYLICDKLYVLLFEQVEFVKHKGFCLLKFFDYNQFKVRVIRVNEVLNCDMKGSEVLRSRFVKILKELVRKKKKEKNLKINLKQVEPLDDLEKIEKFLSKKDVRVRNDIVNEDKKFSLPLVRRVSRDEEKSLIAPIEEKVEVKEIASETLDEKEEEMLGEILNEQFESAFDEYSDLLVHRCETAQQNHADAMDRIVKKFGHDVPLKVGGGGYKLVNSKGFVLKKFSDKPLEKFSIESKADSYQYFFHPGNLKVSRGFYPIAKIDTLEDELGLVSDFTKVYLDPVLSENLKLLRPRKICEFEMKFVQSGPGTGKTTFIVKNFVNDGKTLVVLPTINAKDDVRKRISELFKVDEGELKLYVRTYASVLVNSSDYKRGMIERLWVDEALMMHSGQIIALIKLLEPKSVWLVGDSLQIPFVNRDVDFKNKLEYSDVRKLCEVDPLNILYISYRIPVDVAAIFYDEYLSFNKKYGVEKGLMTVNPVGLNTPSVSYTLIKCVEDVPRISNVQYLTFTQSEKDVLLENSFQKVKTINEFQGSQSEHVICVRLNQYISSEIYTRRPYILVALTRHTKKFEYYTRLEDKMCDCIRVKYSEHDLKKCLYTAGGANVFHHLEGKFGTKAYYGVGESGLMRVSNGMPSKSPYLLRITSGLSKHFDVSLNLDSSNIESMRKKLDDVSAVGIKKVCFDDKFLSYMNANVFFHVLLRKFGTNVKYVLISSVSEFVSNEVFDVINVNVINDYYPVEDVEYFQESLSRDDMIENFGTVTSVESKISILQNFHDKMYPASSYMDMVGTNLLFEWSGLSLFSESMVIGPMKLLKQEIYGCMRPRLETVCQVRRERTLKELLISLNKRNFSVPENQGNINEFAVAEKMRSKFFETYTILDNVPEMMEMDLTSKDILKWLEGQESHVSTKICSDYPLFKQCLNEYNVDIKRDPKVTMNEDVGFLYSACQTIVYHEKSINVIFCPIFRKIRERLFRVLKENVLIFSDCSVEEFELKLSKSFKPKDLCYSKAASMEVDISKFDKSQQRVMLYYECLMMKSFGVPEELIDLWYCAHVFTILKNKDLGLKTFICYQRKSGDAATFLGNTMFLMAVMACFYDLKNIELGLFAGDDSYLRAMNLRKSENKDTQLFALLFNLEVKFFEFDNPYFCSRFLVESSIGEFVVVPDPVKILIKLGRSDLKNLEHVNEYRISLKDNIKVYKDPIVRINASHAVKERYELANRIDVDLLMNIIVELVEEKEQFEEFFEIPEDVPVDEKALLFKF